MALPRSVAIIITKDIDFLTEISLWNILYFRFVRSCYRNLAVIDERQLQSNDKIKGRSNQKSDLCVSRRKKLTVEKKKQLNKKLL